jgi:ATP-binding cassette subfamily F protein uup
VTSSLVMEGNGRVGDYVGGYTDWQRQRPTQPKPGNAAPRLTPEVAKQPVVAPTMPAPATSKRKLSFKDQRELELLPARIESLESQLAALTAEMNTPEFYQRGSGEVQAANKRLADCQAELELAYARWGELE